MSGVRFRRESCAVPGGEQAQRVFRFCLRSLRRFPWRASFGTNSYNGALVLIAAPGGEQARSFFVFARVARAVPRGQQLHEQGPATQ